MKVLYLLDTVNRGGAEMQALDVCRNAANYGIEMTLVTANGGSLEQDFINTGVRFHRLGRRFPLDIYFASQLRKIIKESEIDIVHAYQAVDGLHLYFAARGLSDVKKVLTFQGFIADRKNRLTSKFLIPRMDANLVVSRGLQSSLAVDEGLDTKNFVLVYNGADPDRLRPSGTSIMSELGLSENTLLFGMIGGFYRDPRKDQLTVCRSLPRVFAEIGNAHCIFAGGIESGAEDKAADCINFCIDQRITDRVHFLGARSDVADILGAMDLFVFSSLHEGLPVAVCEAMLVGVPLIVSDIEPLREMTGNGRFASVFPVLDHEELARQLIHLLSEASVRNQLAFSARRHAEENFSIGAHMRSLSSVYRNLLMDAPKA